MNGEQLAHLLQDLIVDVMDEWNESMRGLEEPLRRMPWDQLDPISRALYIQRCERFLERYDVTPKP